MRTNLEEAEEAEEVENKNTDLKNNSGGIKNHIPPRLIKSFFDLGQLKNPEMLENTKVEVNGEKISITELLKTISDKDKNIELFNIEIIDQIKALLKDFKCTQLVDDDITPNEQIEVLLEDIQKIVNPPHNKSSSDQPDHLKINESIKAIQHIIHLSSEVDKTKLTTTNSILLSQITDKVTNISRDISQLESQQQEIATKALAVINPILETLQDFALSGTIFCDKVFSTIKKTIKGDNQGFFFKTIRNKIGDAVPKIKYSTGQKLLLAKREMVKHQFTIADVARLFDVEGSKLVLKADLKSIISNAKPQENITASKIEISMPPENSQKQFFIVKIASQVANQVATQTGKVVTQTGNLVSKIIGKPTSQALEKEEAKRANILKNYIGADDKCYKDNNIYKAQVDFLKEIERIGDLITKELQNTIRLNGGSKDKDFALQFQKLQRNWYDFKCLDNQQNDVVKLFKSAMQNLTDNLIRVIRVTKQLINSLCGDKIDLKLNSAESLNNLIALSKINDPHTFHVVSQKMENIINKGQNIPS